MQNKMISTLLCLWMAGIASTHAQPVKQWQDRHGEWHFGDPRAAPTRGSSEVRIQNPISVINNDRPLPRYTVNNTKSTARSRARVTPPTSQRLSKADCESLRESLRVSPARQQQQQRQQQYERECVMGVYYADSQ